ncbi:MAG: hypothetical protein HYW97_00995 [Candidatus Wildermuthbacteria bacterium]|nr:hypothetical protein [Candidatus Wildermuthbacteria bacterium]
MKQIANRGKTVVLVPLVLEPVEVQVPLVAIVPEFGDVPVAVRVLPGRANVQNIVYATIP